MLFKNKIIRKSNVLLILLSTAIPTFAQNTQGFFLNDFESKSIGNPPFEEVSKPTKASTATVTVSFSDIITPVSKYLFGNNANIYMTQMVDQPTLLNNIKALSPNVIRWPGGNLSSVYFWNAEKNQPPADAPTKLRDANGAEIDPGYWYGKNNEGWTCSLDNYYKMLELTNNTGIITINYGYARYSTATDPVASAAHLAAEWVRYDNGRTKFWEVGNESNGSWQAGFRIKTSDNKDGQPEIITGALYGKHFKVFADSMRKAASDIGATIYIGAQLLQEEPASWWNPTDRYWNAGVFQETKDLPDFYIIHSYYTPYNENSSPAAILNSAAEVTKSMMDYVTKSIHDAGRAQKPVALTEWNIFAVKSKQQVSYINGMHAAIVLGEMIVNKYGLATRWDLANNWDNGDDHGMFSQGSEPGVPRWNARPAFYYMYYFQKYVGDHMVQSSVTGSSDVLAYASKFESGQSGVVVVNKGTLEQTVGLDLLNFGFGNRFYYYTLTGGTDNGQFSLKVYVNGQGPSLSAGGPSNFKDIPSRSAPIGDGIKFTAPARSVTYLLIEHGDNVITSSEKGDTSLLHVHPNPSSGWITLQLPSAGFQSVEILDSKGKQIQHHVVDPLQLRVLIKATLPSGMYLLRVRNSSEIITSKIIID